MDELPPLPDDMLQLDEAYPGMAVADQIRAYGDERAAAAVARERERCAKVCEEIDTANDIAQVWINVAATAIRKG